MHSHKQQASFQLRNILQLYPVDVLKLSDEDPDASKYV